MFSLVQLFAQEEIAKASVGVQYPWEVGGGLLTNSFAGDLVSPDASSIKATSLSLGVFGRLKISDQLHLRAGLSQGRLSASDLDFDDKAERGISVKVNLTELATTFEFEPFGRNPFQEDGSFKTLVSPYLFAGVGVAVGKPQLEYKNTTVESSAAAQQDVNDLKNAHFIVPFGIGLKAYLSPTWTLSTEFGLRPVFNDYLEGVSNAGNPDANDWYGVFSIMLAQRLHVK